MTFGAKTINLRPHLIEKNVTGHEEGSQMIFFEFFLAIILLEIIAIVC